MTTQVPYVVRRATALDIPLIAQVFLDSLDSTIPGKTFSDLPEYALPQVEPVLRARLLPEDGSVTTFVALHPATDELLGYIDVKHRGGPLPQGYRSTGTVQLPDGVPEIDHLFTKVPREGGSGKGVGSALIQRVLAEESWTSAGIRLSCFEKNERALGFYRKWRWEQVGKIGLGVGEDGETALVLWLKGTQA
ncbi:hypothetical protein CALCODRAFT_510087 [Calocera cornea HHB12733]|uniref:N-acetyltransferase domain-containing protein n=1 Tax=Calocera cornea HHB12733 TaxID=1353952 RepID=A0A165ET28_9BASI|nr:hypothetical protein CALCODRAFT_510087 [Calocera cornea HHB12733]